MLARRDLGCDFGKVRGHRPSVAAGRAPSSCRNRHGESSGFVDTEIGCFMKPEVADATTEVFARVQG